jgi:hypothetical protein
MDRRSSRTRFVAHNFRQRTRRAVFQRATGSAYGVAFVNALGSIVRWSRDPTQFVV